MSFKRATVKETQVIAVEKDVYTCDGCSHEQAVPAGRGMDTTPHSWAQLLLPEHGWETLHFCSLPCLSKWVQRPIARAAIDANLQDASMQGMRG